MSAIHIYFFLFFILLITVLFAVLLPNMPGYFGPTETNITYFAVIGLFMFGLVGFIWGHK